MDSRKNNSKKSTASRSGSTKSTRTSKKRKSLFKKKTIKPKVKLDSNRVIGLCVGIVISCAILLIATVLIPDGTVTNPTRPETRTEQPQVKSEIQTVKTESKPIVKTEPKSENKTVKEAQVEKENEEYRKKLEAQLKEKELLEKKLAEEKKKKEEAEALLKQQQAAKEEKKNQTVEKSSFGFPQAVNNAQLVFLLDDGGQNLSQLEKFLSLPMPLTIAVLPKLTNSKAAATRIRAAGKEVMLHQPMQAVNSSVNPGPGAIKPDMTENEIISVMYQNIEEVGPVAGINNHEGSAITADAHKMEVILKYTNENGMFFLDSRTNKDTQVPYVSKALGYSYYERNGLFLDNIKTRENALAEMKKNIDKANREGVVIMIGHVWSADFLAPLLAEVYPELKAKGYVITTVSKCKGRK